VAQTGLGGVGHAGTFAALPTPTVERQVDRHPPHPAWISQGPRASDTTFDPVVGDVVVVGDDEVPPRQARVV
jgi:hypothetical protein